MSDDENQQQVALLIFSFLMFIAMILAHYLIHIKRNQYLNEGSISLMVGIVAGGIYYVISAVLSDITFSSGITTFNKEMFFLFLLPFIFVNAGYRLKKRLFFQNFVTLTLLGVVGTFFSAAIMGMGCIGTLKLLKLKNPATFKQYTQNGLKLGIIVSSTDSLAVLQILDADKQPLLYSLVFGEGVVNDATSIVLLKAAQQIFNDSKEGLNIRNFVTLPGNFLYLFVCSLLLGVAAGLISALIIRSFFLRHHSTDREIFLTILSGILVYVVAEATGLSGIFAIFFCGITMSHYTYHSLSKPAQAVSIYCFRILSFGAETFMFVYSGFDLWGMLHTDWRSKGNWPDDGTFFIQLVILSVALILLVYLSRFIMVYSITQLVNLWRKRIIKPNEMVLIWWGGSFRGAVTIALLYFQFGQIGNYEQTILVSAGTVLVIFTTLIMSIPTKAFVQYLFQGEDSLKGQKNKKGPQKPNLQKPSQMELYRNSVYVTYQSVHRIWRDFDHELLQPVFGGRELAERDQEECLRQKNRQKDNAQFQSEIKKPLYQLLIQEEDEEEGGSPTTSLSLAENQQIKTPSEKLKQRTYSIEVKPDVAKQIMDKQNSKANGKNQDKQAIQIDPSNLFNDIPGDLDESEQENESSDADQSNPSIKPADSQNQDESNTSLQGVSIQKQPTDASYQLRQPVGTPFQNGAEGRENRGRTISLDGGRRQGSSKSPFIDKQRRQQSNDHREVWQLH